MPTVRLEKGLSVRTFRAPPERFKPEKADARAFARYGFPVRPAEQPLAELWDATVKSGMRVIEPAFRLDGNLPVAVPEFPEIAHFVEDRQTDYISGAETEIEPATGRFRWVEATFTVPNIYENTTVFGDRVYSCAPWVGLAGPESSLQAGVYSYIREQSNQWQRSYSVWWRWAPGRAVWLDNFPIMAGDLLSVVLCLELESTVKARVYLRNMTSLAVTTFLVTAPPGVQLIANFAGWLVQAEEFSEGRYLARMGAVYYDGCNAGLEGVPGILHPTRRVHMTDKYGSDIVAYGSILSETMVKVGYAGD